MTNEGPVLYKPVRMSSPSHVLVVGAGAAGLMAGRELARAGTRVTVLEGRDRLGGRIWKLPEAEFGYPAEGGPEFLHGAALVTRRLVRDGGLTLTPRFGARWGVRNGVFATTTWEPPHADRFVAALHELDADLPIAEFLATRFPGDGYAELRRSVTRMAEGYDAADPARMSTFAVREEWTSRDADVPMRIKEGYGGLIDYLAADCRRHGGEIRMRAAVMAIEETGGKVTAHCRNGAAVEADAAIVTVPLPLLREITWPETLRERVALAVRDIGYGNVVKLVLRFKTMWWATHEGRDLSDLAFLLTDARVPTWWTQHPDPHPVLTGWYSGLKADTVAAYTEDELIDMGLASLAQIFGRPADELKRGLQAARGINWGNDEFARGAYSYATPKTAAAMAALAAPAGRVFISGEALYAGPDRGTVEAALAHGEEVARRVLSL
jgi:monoamine oxidase